MYPIIHTSVLAPTITRLVVRAPYIARKRKAGNFVMVRVDDHGERIPLTLADSDPEGGTITLIIQAVGKTTRLLCSKNAGEFLLDQLIAPVAESALGVLHDVSLVHQGDARAPVLEGILDRPANQPLGGGGADGGGRGGVGGAFGAHRAHPAGQRAAL